VFALFDFDFVGGKTDALPSISPKEEKALIPKIGRFASSGLICGNPDESDSEEDCAAKPTCRLIRTESFRNTGAVTTPTRRKRSASALATPHAPGYRIAFVVNCSRGDLIPCLAVARLFIRKENRVHMFISVDSCKIADEFGIDSTPIFPNMHWVITEIGGVGGTSMDMWREGRKAAQKYLRENKGICMNAYDSLVEFKPELIIATTGALGAAMQYESKFNVVVCNVLLVRDTLELVQSFLAMEPKRPHFFPLCEILDNDPPPTNQFIRTNEWYLDTYPQPGELDQGGRFEELKNFLADGPPPVVLGWGLYDCQGDAPKQRASIRITRGTRCWEESHHHRRLGSVGRIRASFDQGRTAG